MLPPIPKNKDEQIRLLEMAVGELIELLMNWGGWDNYCSALDLLPDECYRIAERAYTTGVFD